MSTKTVTRVSVAPTGRQFANNSIRATISPNGRWIGWLVDRWASSSMDAYRWDRSTKKSTRIATGTYSDILTSTPTSVAASDAGVSYETCTTRRDTSEQWGTVYAVAAPSTLSFTSIAPCYSGFAISRYGAMALVQESADISNYPGPGLTLFDKSGKRAALPGVTQSAEETLSQDGKVASWAEDSGQVYAWTIATGTVAPVSVADGT